jgi:hypothetical protein
VFVFGELSTHGAAVGGVYGVRRVFWTPLINFRLRVNYMLVEEVCVFWNEKWQRGQ